MTINVGVLGARGRMGATVVNAVEGASDMKLVTLDNPLGIDPKDPKGADDVIVNNPELHLAVGKSVKFNRIPTRR